MQAANQSMDAWAKALGKEMFAVRKLFMLVLISAFAPVYAASLNIEITGVKSSEGQVKLMLFDKAEGFRKEASSSQVLAFPATSGSMQAAFQDLPPGRYAVIVYHDSNANGKLDLRFGMIPIEGYGVSNNPQAVGPPAFDDASMELDARGRQIQIKLSY